MLDKEINLISELHSSCKRCHLKSLCLPQDIANLQLKMFEDIVGHLPPMEEGRYLYHQGGKFINLYIVRSGYVKQTYCSRDGDEQIIGFSFPGELLGIDSIATGYYFESALTLDTATVCTIKYDRLEKLCEKIPGLMKQVLKKASQELIEEHDIRHSFSAKSSTERVAMFFSNLSTRFQSLGYSPHEFLLPMNRSDVGSYLGLAIETVSRSCKKLVDKEIIKVEKRSVSILDPEGLKRLAGHYDDSTSLKVSNSK
jgi:CRP/FNR family transcriptional regulator, anaerobic regulatory protein